MNQLYISTMLYEFVCDEWITTYNANSLLHFCFYSYRAEADWGWHQFALGAHHSTEYVFVTVCVCSMHMTDIVDKA